MVAVRAPRMPVVFVSHGSPDALLQAPDAVACWRDIGQALTEVQAIIAISAHWETRVPTASLAGAPATIHDFAGFPAALYRMRYPAPGAPALAERAAALLAAAGIIADLHPNRGLDHGTWVPLSVMLPAANVPVTQLSLMRQGPAAHLAVGKALAPLRDEGVLIVASGAITHNLDWLDLNLPAVPPLRPAAAFADWVADKLGATETNTLKGTRSRGTSDAAALLDYRRAPHGADAHPSEEHFLPLFVALGAAGDDLPVRLRPRFAYGGLAMDAYVWSLPNAGLSARA